jgi:hypothetical protein
MQYFDSVAVSWKDARIIDGKHVFAFLNAPQSYDLRTVKVRAKFPDGTVSKESPEFTINVKM